MRIPPQLPAGLAELLVLRDNGWPHAAPAVAWAVDALQTGLDCPSLRVLAGLDLQGAATDFEVLPLVAAILRELNLTAPDRNAAARLYVRETAEAIVTGRMRPELAVDLIHARVIEPLNHPDDLMSWCHVWEGNAVDLSRSLDDGERNMAIVALAAAVLRDPPNPALQPTPQSRRG